MVVKVLPSKIFTWSGYCSFVMFNVWLYFGLFFIIFTKRNVKEVYGLQFGHFSVVSMEV